MNVTVLGATGSTGRALVHELASRGHTVTAASRSISAADVPEVVRALPTDLTDPAQAHAACAGAEVVVMAAHVPYSRWATELRPLVARAVDATAAAGARFVMVDNLYAYGSPGVPIGAETPEAATTRKGRLRAELGRWLLRQHAEGRLKASIGRFSDHYGPGGTTSLLQMVAIGPALRGRRARGFIDLDQPHTFHHLPDVARGFAEIVERPDADGRTWILPAAPPITQREMLGHVAAALGRELRIGTITRSMLWVAGLVDTELREAREVVAQFDRPYVTDASAFEATFGPVATTGHAEAVARTVAWARAERDAAGRALTGAGDRDRSARRSAAPDPARGG